MPKKKIRIRVGGLVVENGKVLLVEHTKDNDSYFLVPGGGVEFCEDAKSALKREFLEELSVEIIPEDIIYISESISPESSRHILNIVFSCTYKSGEIMLGSDKRLSGYRYFSPEELDSVKVFPDSLSKFIKEIMLSESAGIIYHGNSWKK
ncbi:MAG: NUDIX hydrolase [Spirochaetes bacterium]|nr:NUDIX hydrolase [Spirochaetota bacterium]